MSFKQFILTAVIISTILGSIPCLAANDRPLIFGMNPIPMEWWGYDPLVWNPKELQSMAAAGCASARVTVAWDTVESVRGQRDWSEPDRWVSYCLDNNIEPVMLINSTPTWALPDYVDPNVPVPQARYPAAEIYAEDFKNWCYDVARRYRGRVRYYEFWNEANGYGWYTALTNPQSFSRADQYTPWMVRAYKALKLADPTCQMSTTGIDDGGEGHAAYYLGLIYAYGGQGYFDAVADHPYPLGAGFQSFKLDQIKSTLDAHGDTNVKVWITEFGYSMDPGNYTAYQQYMTDYFNTLTLDKYSFVRIATWHTATEFPWEFGYGLMNKDLTAKPPYTTFKNYTKPSRVVINTPYTTNLSATSVRVNFTTNLTCKCLVMYGTDTTYGNITARETTGSTGHQITMVGLKPGTTYHYRIRAGRATIEDTDSISIDRTFTTTSGSAVSITSGPTVSNITNTTALVTWTTNIPSSSLVDYGTSFSYGGSASDSTLVTNHSVPLTGLTAGINYQYRVTSSATGYASDAAEGRPFTTTSQNVGLTNGGFENGAQGWTFWEVYPWGNDNGNNGVDYPGHIAVYSNGGIFAPVPATMEGTGRIACDVGYASAVGGLYQTAAVDNGTYLVSGWISMGGDGGSELVEIRALDGPYAGGIPAGTVVASVSTPVGWKYYSGPADVTKGTLTIATRVSQWWASGAVAGHFDGLNLRRCTKGKIGSLKTIADGDVVATDSDKVVTMIVDANTVYMQEDDRSAGIKVHTVSPHGLNLYDRAPASGVLRIIDGEAVIDEAGASFVSEGIPPAPLGVKTSSIGANTGVKNTGLLVKVWGKVTATGTDYIKIDDGSGPALKCLLPSGVTPDSNWHYVAVTGISSCYVDGTNVLPVIRVRQGTDIRAIN